MSIDPKALEWARDVVAEADAGEPLEERLVRIARALLAGEGPGWAEAIEAAAAEIEATPELTGFLKGRINAALRALHPSVAEPDK